MDSLFNLSGYTIKDVDKIAVTIDQDLYRNKNRSGNSKGLAYSLKKPIIGINELDVLAEMGNKEKSYYSLIDARKRVYYSQYKYENKNL